VAERGGVLRESFPERALVGRTLLPDELEALMGLEETTPIEEFDPAVESLHDGGERLRLGCHRGRGSCG